MHSLQDQEKSTDQVGDLAVTYGYCTAHTGAYGVERTNTGSSGRYVRGRTGSSERYYALQQTGYFEGLPTTVDIPEGTPTGTPSE